LGNNLLRGSQNRGTIYKINEDGTSYSAVKSFDNLLFGASPQGSLVQAPNGKLYGMTVQGGKTDNQNPFGNGVIFEIDPTTNLFNRVFAFDSTVTSDLTT
jgi:uncharacterized repeat protein (TIGR03803 family)